MKKIAAAQWINLLLTALLAIGLQGCGFKLRGSIDVPPQFRQMQLQANPNSSFTKSLIQQLKANDIKITTQAPLRLAITRNDNEKRTLSYSGRGKSAEYEIIKHVEFSVINTQTNQVMIPKTELQARRAYLFDDTKIAAMNEQEQLIQQELEFDLASKLLLQLQKQKQKQP